MEYDETKHAKYVIKEREISRNWLEQVLENHEKIELDQSDATLKHRLGIVEGFGERVLIIILSVEAKPIRIVTAYFDRTMKGKL